MFCIETHSVYLIETYMSKDVNLASYSKMMIKNKTKSLQPNSKVQTQTLWDEVYDSLNWWIKLFLPESNQIFISHVGEAYDKIYSII